MIGLLHHPNECCWTQTGIQLSISAETKIKIGQGLTELWSTGGGEAWCFFRLPVYIDNLFIGIMATMTIMSSMRNNGRIMPHNNVTD